jgi:hypothetical protein
VRSLFQLWIEKRGITMPACTQRSSSSGSGAGRKSRRCRARCWTRPTAPAQPHLLVVAQRLPVGEIVARPALRIALHPAMPLRVHIGAFGGAMGDLRLARGRIISSVCTGRSAAAGRGAPNRRCARARPRSRTRCCRSRWSDAVVQQLLRHLPAPPCGAASGLVKST